MYLTLATSCMPCHAQGGDILTGADQVDNIFGDLSGKKLALMVNQTSVRTDGEHLVDYLMSKGQLVTKIFAPEHGFRGDADAGAYIEDGRDKKSGLPVISLYGQKKKPTSYDLRDVDIVIFDIQDVGVRYYTYLSSLHYLMEACAEQDIAVLVLDRPNPNGHYIDGPILDTAYRSFVGMHPVPIVHGMTVAEYALMIKGEKWINEAGALRLSVLPCLNYKKSMHYELPVKPSPNLPNARSILLYPQLCLFEGTPISVGRGTDTQFQVVGHPDLKGLYAFYFIPESKPGALSPLHMGKKCYGMDLTNIQTEELLNSKQVDLDIVISFYQSFPEPSVFFLKNGFFDKLAGGQLLRKQITQGLDAQSIRASWQEGLKQYDAMRSDYLIYPK